MTEIMQVRGTSKEVTFELRPEWQEGLSPTATCRLSFAAGIAGKGPSRGNTPSVLRSHRKAPGADLSHPANSFSVDLLHLEFVLCPFNPNTFLLQILRKEKGRIEVKHSKIFLQSTHSK